MRSDGVSKTLLSAFVLVALVTFGCQRPLGPPIAKRGMQKTSGSNSSNISGGNLTGWNVTGGNLTGSNITGSNITGSNITGSNITGSNITGSNFTNSFVLAEVAEPAAVTVAKVEEPKTEAAAADPAPAKDEAVATEATAEVEEEAPAKVVEKVEPIKVEPIIVELGSPELTEGIPGEGALSTEEIKAWLDTPGNHAEIKPTLPMGLAAAVANIKGLDENPMTKAKIELGRQLYFDKRLSKDSTVSCADCHHPEQGYGKHTQFGVGIGGQKGGRNSPVSYNRILSAAQFWDGRAASLEEQAGGPIANPIEMGNTHENAIKTLEEIEGYKLQFDRIFPDKGITVETLTKAIATFERAIVTGPAPYDYYERVQAIERSWGDEIEDLEEEDPAAFKTYLAAKEGSKAMTESAIKGRELFFSEKVGCTACHAGANFTDELYHNIGVGMDAEKPDVGRFEVTKESKDMGAFKTPTVRNVAASAPYMHDGSQKTLEEVVEWYAKGGHPNEHLSDKIKKFEMTEEDKKALVDFMTIGLTGDFPKVETGRLPE